MYSQLQDKSMQHMRKGVPTQFTSKPTDGARGRLQDISAKGMLNMSNTS